MSEFTIQDEDLLGMENKVVIVTGCSSGIGLATTQLLLKLDAKVVGGDLHNPPTDHPNFTFLPTNVTNWTDLLSLFKTAITTHNRIDHIYANAGIEGRINYLEQKLDSKGDLLEPNNLTFEINLKSVSNTAYLALQFLRQNPRGGSIVLIASTSSFQRFRVVDYCSAKHGVVGLMRGLVPVIRSAGLPIRINTMAPSWTESGIAPKDLIEAAGKRTQGPEVVARNVAYLMADEGRNGQLIYSWEGRYKEIEAAVFERAVDVILEGQVRDDVVLERLEEMMKEKAFGTKE